MKVFRGLRLYDARRGRVVYKSWDKQGNDTGEAPDADALQSATNADITVIKGTDEATAIAATKPVLMMLKSFGFNEATASYDAEFACIKVSKQKPASDEFLAKLLAVTPSGS